MWCCTLLLIHVKEKNGGLFIMWLHTVLVIMEYLCKRKNLNRMLQNTNVVEKILYTEVCLSVCCVWWLKESMHSARVSQGCVLKSVLFNILVIDCGLLFTSFVRIPGRTLKRYWTLIPSRTNKIKLTYTVN